MHALTHSITENGNRPTILVIEDDEDNLLYVASALQLFNYRCFAACNAMVGLGLAQEHQPDLILLDVRMPQISGIELAKALKLDWLTRKIPIVAVTSLAREKEIRLILDAGFNDYLIKPYLLEDLEKVICSNILNTSLC